MNVNVQDRPRLGCFPMAADEYFADHSAWSQSMLKVFTDRRRLAEAYYVLKSEVEPEPTDPMRKGTATHTAILEPERFDELVITYPRELLAKNGAVSTNEAKDFRDQHVAAGRIVLKAAEVATVRAMALSVRRVCGHWLSLPCRKEHSVYWQDSLTGLRCKCRLDWLIERKKSIVFDLKTTNDASPVKFRSRVEDGKYWLQAAQYIDGVKTATGAESVEFYLIAVESEFPFACAIYSLDHASLVAAGSARRQALKDLAGCLASGDFSEPWEQAVTPLPLRSRCFSSDL